MPQLLKRFLEFCKNYFLSQFTSFTRKSVLLLYNYTFFLKSYYPAWSPTWFTTLGSKLTCCFQNSNALSKDEDLPLLKMCLRLWRQFPKRSPKMCMAPTHCLPAGSNPPHSHKHLQDPASVKLSITASGMAKLFERHVCIYHPHFFMSLPLFWL